MEMKEIGIVGGGIVGATAAYYLARAGFSVSLFDDKEGQATSAAAGIICPWFTLRRNKPWYYLVSNGAEFYRKLVADLEEDGFLTNDIFYESGAMIIRKNQASIDRDAANTVQKLKDSPSIQATFSVPAQQTKDYFPLLSTAFDATFVQGGARVDGRLLVNTLIQAFIHHGGHYYQERVRLKATDTIVSPSLGDKSYSHLLLAVGAWLPDLLQPLGYQVGIRPQKGQLVVLENKAYETSKWPVLMPPGKIDIIPNGVDRITIGATHEDDAGYSLEVEDEKIQELILQAKEWIPNIDEFSIESTRVGIRAYTKDSSVLVGQVPNTDNVWAVSGLGSSGLTSGPFIGYQWSKLIQEGSWEINQDDYPINQHIIKI